MNIHPEQLLSPHLERQERPLGIGFQFSDQRLVLQLPEPQRLVLQLPEPQRLVLRSQLHVVLVVFVPDRRRVAIRRLSFVLPRLSFGLVLPFVPLSQLLPGEGRQLQLTGCGQLGHSVHISVTKKFGPPKNESAIDLAR